MAITFQAPKTKPAATVDDDRLMTAAQVRRFFGGVSNMCIHRWVKDDKLGFPKPIFIHNTRYWRASEIDAFVKAQEKARAAKQGVA